MGMTQLGDVFVGVSGVVFVEVLLATMAMITMTAGMDIHPRKAFC